MRLAFVTLQYPPDAVGGIGTYVQTVATALAAAGHDVTVICPAAGQARSTSIEDGVRVERFAPPGPERLWKRFVAPEQSFRVRIQHALWSAWAVRSLRARVDVVEVPEWKAQGLLIRLLSRLPVVVHLHLTYELEQAWNGVTPSRGQRLSHRLERLTATRATARTATSRQTTRFPDGSCLVPDREVEIVAPPIPVEEWAGCGAVTRTDPTVLFVGRLERRKAPELLLDALARLVDEVEDLRVVFVGRAMNTGGRSYVDVLREQAAEHGIRCEIRGPTASKDEMLDLYESARVVAIPSRFETLSMVAFEALACGRPAVMTDQIGAAEWVRGHLDDLVVPFGDADALANALRPHLTDVAHAVTVGERGRTLVREVCAPERVVDSRMQVYRRLAENGQR